MLGGSTSAASIWSARPPRSVTRLASPPRSFATSRRCSRTKDYLSALGKLQAALGHLNDLATGERIIDELEPHLRTGRLVHGAGIVRGWLSGAEAPALADADRAWRKFAKAKPFWH